MQYQKGKKINLKMNSAAPSLISSETVHWECDSVICNVNKQKKESANFILVSLLKLYVVLYTVFVQ